MRTLVAWNSVNARAQDNTQELTMDDTSPVPAFSPSSQGSHPETTHDGLESVSPCEMSSDFGGSGESADGDQGDGFEQQVGCEVDTAVPQRA